MNRLGAEKDRILQRFFRRDRHKGHPNKGLDKKGAAEVRENPAERPIRACPKKLR